MSGVFSKISAIFRRRPLLSNVAAYTSMICTAEFTQQTILKRYDPERKYDFSVVARYAIIGTCIYGPSLFYFYRALDKALPATTVAVSLQKALIDQALLSSTMLVAFYTAMSVLEGKEDVFAEMKAKWWPTYKLSCLFWIPVQCCNFLFMPPAARVVTVGACSFVWVNILCVCKRNSSVPGAKEHAAAMDAISHTVKAP
ncbi:mpv17-like protein [Galendromus occidentalis]|uniref:Mpv17-like protein n=1 Tax=Galendromus occidentalis TaxID=34638 RepID=A0AAJ6QT55_9ACAR|nr:mpv17-like protein [Galendromus occidentalis]